MKTLRRSALLRAASGLAAELADTAEAVAG
jgi:hypothetical protein